MQTPFCKQKLNLLFVERQDYYFQVYPSFLIFNTNYSKAFETQTSCFNEGKNQRIYHLQA